MKEIWDKIKGFFKDKLNLIAVCLTILFFALVPICNIVEFMIKVDVWIMSAILCIIGYKFLIKHKNSQKINDIIDSTTQKQENSSIFSKISDKYDSYNKKTYLIYSIVFFSIAIMLIIYTIIK